MDSSLNIFTVLPPSFFEEKNLTIEEINDAQRGFRQIFNISDNSIIDISHPNYGDLIKMIAFVNRSRRCKESIEFLISEFRRLFQGVYKTSYNLIFTGMWLNDVIVPPDIISQLKFEGERFENLSDSEKIVCTNLKVLIKEIFCLTQLFKSSISNGNYPSIQDLYNYLDKLNLLFKELFHFRIAEINRNGILEPYALLRHAIAQSHFIFIGEQIRLVDWQIKPVRKVNNILNFNLNEVREEMTFLSLIFCQIIVLYQLMQQTKGSVEL